MWHSLSQKKTVFPLHLMICWCRILHHLCGIMVELGNDVLNKVPAAAFTLRNKEQNCTIRGTVACHRGGTLSGTAFIPLIIGWNHVGTFLSHKRVHEGTLRTNNYTWIDCRFERGNHPSGRFTPNGTIPVIYFSKSVDSSRCGVDVWKMDWVWSLSLTKLTFTPVGALTSSEVNCTCERSTLPFGMKSTEHETENSSSGSWLGERMDGQIDWWMDGNWTSDFTDTRKCHSRKLIKLTWEKPWGLTICRLSCWNDIPPFNYSRAIKRKSRNKVLLCAMLIRMQLQ